MLRSIVTNPAKLSLISKRAYDPEVIQPVIKDLIDTATHWQQETIGCAGLAANQIGELWRVIVINYEGRWLPMINPSWEPIKRAPTDCKREGCLSRPGIHTRMKRYKKILVTYTTHPEENMIQQRFTGFVARVIQHECDHLDGKFI